MAKRIWKKYFVYLPSQPRVRQDSHTIPGYINSNLGMERVSRKYFQCMYIVALRVTLEWMAMAYVAYGTMRHLSEDTGPGGGHF